MKSNFLIVGIILVGVGIGMFFYGYHQMQPTKLERFNEGINKWAESLSGEKMPSLPKRNITASILTIVLGGISFVGGLIVLLKSKQKDVSVGLSSQKQDEHLKYCSNCGSQISDADKFCPKCGTKINKE